MLAAPLVALRLLERSGRERRNALAFSGSLRMKAPPLLEDLIHRASVGHAYLLLLGSPVGGGA